MKTWQVSIFLHNIFFLCEEMKICLGLIFILYDVHVVPEHFCFCDFDGCVCSKACLIFYGFMEFGVGLPLESFPFVCF